jgi:Tol biopolymer transport system component
LVAFTSDRDGTANTNIFTISATGTQSGLHRLTTATARDEDAAWSRDGLRLVFMSTRITTANPEIYRMAANGSSQMRLTNKAGDDLTPGW